ncbi:hypothetical protein HJFPF1_07015 [Paramyrothecium foliicola]|nr:hypothetical protein HJFPF1_07015 [Paramyrothecium foliicola]
MFPTTLRKIVALRIDCQAHYLHISNASDIMEDQPQDEPKEPDPRFPTPENDPFGSLAESSTSKDAESSPLTKKEKGRVRFNSNAAATTPPVPPPRRPDPAQAAREGPAPKPRPSVLRFNSSSSVATVGDVGDDFESAEAMFAAAAAQERAEQVAANLRRGSFPPKPKQAMSVSTNTLVNDDGHFPYDGGIPLQELGSPSSSRDPLQRMLPEIEHENPQQEEAYKLVESHTQRFGSKGDASPPSKETPSHGPVELSNVNGGYYDGVYKVEPPQQYRGSVLSQLLKLYKTPDLATPHTRASFSSHTGGHSTPGTESGTTTPTRRKWYDQNRSTDTLANLIGASAQLANPNKTPDPKNGGPKKHAKRPSNGGGSGAGGSRLSALWQREEVRITVHIAETLARQEYIIKFCRALMLYGAPTHRLEEYLSMTARVLEIDGQFLYLPGCMIISFDDRSTHTTEVRIVRTAQGIDLGKLKDVHRIYKEVMHDVVGVEEGTKRLEALMNAKEKFNPWLRVLTFGLTSVTVAPFSFSARLIDLPICFVLGCLVGFLQLIVAPMSNLYSNVLEVSATVAVSFLARAFGSIRGGTLFCFSAVAQSGIVMLLPGYLVLCSSLELQSKAIVPGSIRIVYAIIYSLLLGFGITVGAVLYGLIDNNASSATTCENPMPAYYAFAFVPAFDICISILYQAKWRQMPVMTVIAFAGYIVNYFSSLKFAAAPQISNTLGAFTVGVLANLYSRLRHGVAAATLIPAIFTQVPGGLASTGGLLSGLSTANLLTNSTQPVNGTGSVPLEEGQSTNNLVFNVAASMIQIAIGIAVGLFLSALVVYPLGKRRSGLFSF